MKRMTQFAVLALLGLVPCSAMAEAPEAAAKVLKADFAKEVSVAEARKLLGWAGEAMYWLKDNGAIDVVDGEGKVLRTLPTREGKESVLKQPEAIAAGDDAVYVVDRGMDQVVAFSAAGKYLYSFPGKQGGFFSSGGDELSALKSPRGVAFHRGIVYVADTGNKRIQQFGANGVFLQSIDIRPGAASKNAKDKDAYKLNEPTDIGVDDRGWLYVLDEDDGRVKIYDAHGEYQGRLPMGGKVHALAVAPDGVYAIEEDSFTTFKYDPSGKLMYQFGSKGEGKAQFKSINGLAVGKGNQVFIGDAKKQMATLFVADMGRVSEAIPRSASQPYVQWQAPLIAAVSADDLAWGSKETVYAVDRDNKTVLKIRGGQSETFKLKEVTPVAVAAGKDGAVWVLDRKKNRVLRLDEAGQIASSFGSEGKNAGQFDTPVDIAVSGAGQIYVADRGNKSVLIFSSEGVFVRSLRGNGEQALQEPVALSFDVQDNVYVLDKSGNRVAVFSPQGELVLEWGKGAEGEPGTLVAPQDVLALTDEVLVLDGNRIKVFSRQGKYLRAFAAKGKASGEVDEPVSMVARDSATVQVAERGNKRIQTFAMMYSPAAPEQVKVQEGVHALELRWAKPLQAYIKRYNVYRAIAEAGPYVKVATVAEPQYADQGLEPGVQYFYRVGAETQYGIEGASSVAVGGTPLKFVPKAIDTAKVEATPWQLKLNWPAAEPQYFAAYQIYQKDGEAYVRVAESLTPEFTKDALTPDTNYVFYVAVRSTDGTESEKLAISGTTLTFNRPPLDIEVIKLRDIFSNTYKLYEQEGVGLIRLTNNTNKTMERLRIFFTIKNFMDFPTEEKIEKLLPGQSEELPLRAVFNNSILTVTEDTSVQTSVEAAYFENGKRVVYTKNPTLTVYEKHRLMWNERGRFAAFITPKDTPLISFVRSVATQYKETKDEAMLAAAVFNAMGLIGLTYLQDPTNPYQVISGKTNVVDYIQFPRETLERKSGDCDDLVAFYTAALESLGIATRVIEVPGHMLMMFSTGADADDDGYTMDEMYVVHEGKLWIPVETTLVGKSFVKAWETGSANYHKWKDNGLTILNVEDEWQTYKPATLPDTTWKAIDITREALEKRYPNEFTSMLKISSQTKTRRYLQALSKNPADVEANLQLGIIMAKAGDLKEAAKYFDKVIATEPKNASAWNNRGNLYMMQDRYKDAQKAYLSAAQASPKDAEVWVNLAKSYKATNDTKRAKEAFGKAQTLEPSIKKKYKALSLELMSGL